MSRLWREQAHIFLSPHGVTVERFARGIRRVRKDLKSAPCAGPGWQPALDALKDLLVHPDIRAADATVVLSNHFVRYLLIPFDPSLASQGEEEAYARARMVQVHGEAAREWVLRLSAAMPDAPRIAAGVERPLLDALGQALRGSGLRLRSVQPRLMWALNAARRTVPDNAWISIAEPGRLVLGLRRAGSWVSLRARPLNGPDLPLQEILDQECLLLGIERGEERVFALDDARPLDVGRGPVPEQPVGVAA